jgi:hypothetical protein
MCRISRPQRTARLRGETAPYAEKPRLAAGPFREETKFRSALLPALLVAASALLIAAVRVLLLLLAWLALSALLRIALLLLTRLAVRIILVLRILVRIGHCGSPLWRHRRTNSRATATFLRFSGSIAPEQFAGT